MRKNLCPDCRGPGICDHGRRKDRCKQCGGSSICPHGRQKHLCRECGGNAICVHGRRRHRCKECGGRSICAHGRRKDQCRECGGKGHGKPKMILAGPIEPVPAASGTSGSAPSPSTADGAATADRSQLPTQPKQAAVILKSDSQARTSSVMPLPESGRKAVKIAKCSTASRTGPPPEARMPHATCNIHTRSTCNTYAHRGTPPR
jgi:hypothetical protein